MTVEIPFVVTLILMSLSFIIGMLALAGAACSAVAVKSGWWGLLLVDLGGTMGLAFLSWRLAAFALQL